MELIINAETYHCPDVGDIANLKLYGPIDQQSVQVFESTVLELYRKGICRIVLDLTDTKYLNSTGLGLLINIAHKVNVVGGGIRLVNVAEKFKVLFDMLGLETCLPILSGYEEAIESFGAKVQDLIPLDGEATEKATIEEEEPEDEDEDDEEGDTEQGFTFEGLLIDTKMVDEEDEGEEEYEEQEQEQEQEQEEYEDEEYEEYEEQQEESEAEEQQEQEGEDEEYEDEEYEDEEQYGEDEEEEEDEDEEGEPQSNFTFEGFMLETGAEQDGEEKSEAMVEQRTEPKETPPKQAIPAEEEKPAKKLLLEKTLGSKAKKLQESSKSRVLFEPEKIKREDIPKKPRKVEEKTQDKIVLRPVKRKATVRYYNQMNTAKTYPMSVMLAEKPYKTPQDETSNANLQKPMLVVIPRFPGCQVSPERVAIDISSSKAVSEFWITPFTKGSPQGNIPGWVEIWYQGKIQEHFPSPYKIVNSILTVISIVCTFLFSLGGVVLDRVQPNAKGLPLLESAIQSIGWRPFGVIMGAIFLILSIVFFLKFHDREAEPLEKISTIKMH